MIFSNNSNEIVKRWNPLLNAGNGITDEAIKTSTAIVLENTQKAVDAHAAINNNRGLLTEDAGIAVGTGTAPGVFGTPTGDTSYAAANADARVPSIVIPMVRRIFPNLIAHQLVGVQPLQGPIGMAFAYRAKYGKNRNGVAGSTSGQGDEIGYVNAYADFTGKPQTADKYTAVHGEAVNGLYAPSGSIEADPQDTAANAAYSCFFGADTYMGINKLNGAMIGDGADTGDAENWAVGSTMPEAGFEFLKATVTAKTRKLGVQITRETEEDMKAMQGISAQNEISDIISYEIAQEIDRQLLAEIVQAAVRAGNTMTWNPAAADGRNQTDRINSLYTTILTKSAQIATQSRRGAANWAVCSPGAAALLESHIYNPLGVAGGLGNANAFGKAIDNNIGVTEIGTLRNGTIKLFRDTLAGGEYILLGYKGNNVYDAGVIYLPYIPLELMHAVDPFTMNPVTAARTRYGTTTNLFGAGQFYSFIGLPNLSNAVVNDDAVEKVFVQA